MARLVQDINKRGEKTLDKIMEEKRRLQSPTLSKEAMQKIYDEIQSEAENQMYKELNERRQAELATRREAEELAIRRKYPQLAVKQEIPPAPVAEQLYMRGSLGSAPYGTQVQVNQGIPCEKAADHLYMRGPIGSAPWGTQVQVNQSNPCEQAADQLYMRGPMGEASYYMSRTKFWSHLLPN